MSVQHANIGIVKKDLQLYYNREYLKSFKGEATGNIAYTTNNYLNSNANWWTNSGSTIFNDNDASIAKPVIINVDTTDLRVFSSTVTAVGDQQLGSSIIPISGSTQYTMSIYCWFSGTSMAAQPYLRTSINNNSLGTFAYNGDTNYLNWPRSTWIRLTVTFTTQANETGVYMSSYTGNNVGEKLAYFGYQLEQKAYATPLVLGSRAETVTNLYSADPYDGFDFVTVYNYVGSTGATISVDTISNPINAPTVLKYNTASGGYMYFALTKTGLASGTYTVSYYARLESGGPSAINNAQLWRDNVSDRAMDGDPNPTIYTYWRRFRVTALVTSGTLHFFPIHNNPITAGYTIYFTGFQLESGDRAKSFTPSSVTANTVASGGGLLDISGNNVNADLTNVLFNSSGYFFNAASSTRIIAKTYTATDTFWRNLGAISIWFKTSTNQNGTLVGWGDNGSVNFGSIEITADWTAGFADESLIAESYNATASQRAVLRKGANYYANGIWNNVTAVFDDNYLNLMIYINGVLETTSNNGNSSGAPFLNVSTSTSYFNIGRRTVGGGDEYFTGEIGQVLVYGKILTAAEVLQNFNATRKTYGL